MSKDEVKFSPLYEEIENAFKFQDKPSIPKSITDNIKQPLRPYQEQALENFIFYSENKYYEYIKNKHLLFHMATGSGKTNIVASAILYLYEKGYRNFIFFVNTTNIITKTKQNLANSNATKYLYKEKIIINGKKVNVNTIENSFEDSKMNDINIMFTTIQKLHMNLNNVVENSVTYESFDKDKIVLIADEAHHLNSELKNIKENDDEDKKPTWGNTVERLLKRNDDNILMEFTATAEIKAKKEIQQHYEKKIVFEYSFSKFRNDGFSKEVALIHSGFTQELRILQAIMISEYRQIVAEYKALDIALKPVVLFKNPKGIKYVDANFEDFNKLIDNLNVESIDEVFHLSDVLAIKELQECIKDDIDGFVKRLKYSFRENNCVKIYSTSKDKSETLNLLNNLEDEHNNIRVIFAVNVLNEGWDVLNLFDIVKLDETSKSSKSTTSEAQLVGRGARYFPFEYNDKDKYKRKYDDDISNPFRMMETMYFHSVNNNDYIQKLKTELGDMGILDENERREVTLTLKQNFLSHDLYKTGVVYVNARTKIDKSKVIHGISYYEKSYKTNYIDIDNRSIEIKFLDENMESANLQKTIKFKLKDFNKDIVRVAINKNESYYFKNLKTFFPNLKSINDFITNSDYLADVEFFLQSAKYVKITDNDKIDFVSYLVDYLEIKILKNAKDYEATKEFYPQRISHKVKKEKVLKLKDSDSKINIDEEWYAFEEHYGTSEEYNFTKFFYSISGELKEKYQDIKLIRNEKSFNIHTFDIHRNADKFEPDFILFLQDKKGCYHQIFIEPKGNWTKDTIDGFENSHEKWKNLFLLDITKCTNNGEIKLANVNKDNEAVYDENKCYKVYGLPFYNKDMEDEFKNDFKELLL